MFENSTNLYEKLEIEMSDLLKYSITFWVFHGRSLGSGEKNISIENKEKNG